MDKTCRTCGETKPLTEFYRRGNGHFFRCKPCHSIKGKEWRDKNVKKISEHKSRYHRLVKYGMSQADFDAMLAKQGGRCGCCKSPTPKTKLGWSVDHNHKTGAVRAILCRPCNQTIGYCEENLSRLKMIADYIKRHEINQPEQESLSLFQSSFQQLH